MPYRKKSKCDGIEVSDGWINQVVTFDGRPHLYNTMNLPSWNVNDYPFVNDCEFFKDSDWQTDGSNTQSEHLKMLVMSSASLECRYEFPGMFGPIAETTENWHNRYKIRFRDWWNTGHGFKADYPCPMGYYLYNSATDSITIYHGKNFFHWDNNQRGATTIKDEGMYGGGFGALFGRLKWPCPYNFYPNSAQYAGEWHDPARWTGKVYGIQFEWDSGIDFDDDEEVQTDDACNGYGLKDLFLHFVCFRPGIDQGDEVAEAMVLPLMQDWCLMDDICYWYEGYSLWDNRPWRQSGDYQESVESPQYVSGSYITVGEAECEPGPGQGGERGNPLRRGKCGFAVDSRSKLWQILHNGTWTVDERDVEMYGKDPEDSRWEAENIKNGGILDYGETYLYSTNNHPAPSSGIHGAHSETYEAKWQVNDGTLTQNPRRTERDFNGTHRQESPMTGQFILTGVTVGLYAWGDRFSASRPRVFRCWNVKPITVPVTYQDPEQRHKTNTFEYSPYSHNKSEWNYDTYRYDKVGPPASGVVHDVNHPMGPGHHQGSEQVLSGLTDGVNGVTSHLRLHEHYEKLLERGYKWDLPTTGSIPLTGAYASEWLSMDTVEGNGGGVPN